MKHKSIILFLLLLSMAISAQKSFTLDDLIPGGKTYSRFLPKTLPMIQWRGNEYIYTKGKDTLYSVNPADNKEKVILTTEQLNAAFAKRNAKKITQIPTVFFLSGNENIAIFSHDAHIFGYDVDKQEITLAFREESDWEREEICHPTKYLAFTKENNLYISTPDNKIKAVTQEENKDIVCGRSVHREEFGIEKGTFWSPKGNYLAFYRMDQTMVENYPLVDISAREAKLENIKYPMAGMKSHQVTIGIYDVKNEMVTYLKTGNPKDRYFTNITWSPDEKLLYIAELNRGQDTCQLNTYNIVTGKKEATLFQETHPKYVEPKNPPILLAKSNQFIWQSQRDGFNHLYVYQNDGKLIKQLTSGNWVIRYVIGVDEKEENIIALTTEDSPIESHPYKINIKTGERTKLSSEAGFHDVRISKSGKYMLDIYSSQTIRNNIDLIYADNKKKINLLAAENPYKDYKTPKITLGTKKAADGSTDLYYRLIKPVDFDATKKYPVVVYVYGGPSLRLVQNSWLGNARGWDIYMAQKGYVVFSIDNRGSKDRGLDNKNLNFKEK